MSQEKFKIIVKSIKIFRKTLLIGMKLVLRGKSLIGFKWLIGCDGGHTN